MKKSLGTKPLIIPMPAVLLATYSKDGTANAMTAAWASSCCHKPPCLGVAVRKNRLTYDNILLYKAFSMNIPRSTQAAEVDYLGLVSGKQVPDKLEKCGLETTLGTKINAPLVVECPVNIELELSGQLDLGSHTWFVGEIVETHVDTSCLKHGDRLDVDLLDPLCYATSESAYHKLGPKVQTAFSVGKSFIKK